jgi:hypothetical protein
MLPSIPPVGIACRAISERRNSAQAAEQRGRVNVKRNAAAKSNTNKPAASHKRKGIPTAANVGSLALAAPMVRLRATLEAEKWNNRGKGPYEGSLGSVG